MVAYVDKERPLARDADNNHYWRRCSSGIGRMFTVTTTFNDNRRLAACLPLAPNDNVNANRTPTGRNDNDISGSRLLKPLRALPVLFMALSPMTNDARP